MSCCSVEDSEEMSEIAFGTCCVDCRVALEFESWAVSDSLCSVVSGSDAGIAAGAAEGEGCSAFGGVADAGECCHNSCIIGDHGLAEVAVVMATVMCEGCAACSGDAVEACRVIEELSYSGCRNGCCVVPAIVNTKEG